MRYSVKNIINGSELTFSTFHFKGYLDILEWEIRYKFLHFQLTENQDLHPNEKVFFDKNTFEKTMKEFNNPLPIEKDKVKQILLVSRQHPFGTNTTWYKNHYNTYFFRNGYNKLIEEIFGDSLHYTVNFVPYVRKKVSLTKINKYWVLYSEE